MIAFSQIFAYFIFLLGIFLIFITKYNISLLIIGVFLLYNIKSEKNSLICLKKKLLCNELYDKSFLNIKNIAVYTDTKLIECMEYFSYNTLLNVVVFSYNNKKLSEFSQYEIIDLLTKNSTLINFTDAINMKGYTNELKE